MHGNVDEWLFYLQDKLNIHPLRNEHRKIYHNATSDSDGYICLAGVDDLIAAQSHIPDHALDYRKALNGCESAAAVLLMVHQPNAAQMILADATYGSMIDVVLSGHTHGGQMYFFLPFVYIGNAYTRGLYRDARTGAQIFVSAGVNYFGPPVKMFGLCEIVEITLVGRTGDSTTDALI